MKKLKSMQLLDDKGVSHKIQCTKYRPLHPDGSTEYDEDGEAEYFDQFTLRGLLKDYMETDPASRYEIAKNAFERALFDAKVDFDSFPRDFANFAYYFYLAMFTCVFIHAGCE